MAQIAHRLGSSQGFRPVRQSYIQEGLVNMFNLFQAWSERRRTRNHLYQMPDYMLHDIGVSRSEVETEWSKPFWKV